MAWQYISAILHGITLHEIASCAYFIFSLGLENPRKQMVQPLFWMCTLTLVTGTVAYGCLTGVLNWRMDNAALLDAAPTSPAIASELNKWFIPVATAGAVGTILMQFFLGMVILIRTLKIYQNSPKHWFRYYTFVMTGLLTIGTIGGVIYAIISFGNGIANALFPAYRIYVIFGGFLCNFLMAVHTTISAVVFLYMIYSTRGFTMKQFVLDWLLKQDGFRYLILGGINAFSVYCYIDVLLRGQNMVNFQMYF
jgi:hypothetical protein